MFVGITTILCVILTTENTKAVVLTLHKEKLTWSEARAVCLQDGGTLISDYNHENFDDLMANFRAPVWEGRYYSPWVWIIGCYSYQNKLDPIEIKDNQMNVCQNHCHNTNFFGLKGNTCFCFDSFEGSSMRTVENCTYKCRGNADETCGGENAITIYMNDICYTNSTEWQGTVSQSKTGKPCRPWASKTKYSKATEKQFPDGYAKNASNFCRDPSNKSQLWCYISQKNTETCAIPQCIEAANDGISSCMSFKKPSNETFQFKQESCFSKNYAICVWDSRYIWNHSKGTWQHARVESRQYDRNGRKCKSLVGPSIFRLPLKADIKSFQWFGYYREICRDGKIVPNRRPKKCFSLLKENENIISKIEDCENRNAFICQNALPTLNDLPLTTELPATTEVVSTEQSTLVALIRTANGDHYTLSGGALAGLIVGLVIFVAIVFGTTLFIIRRRKTPQTEETKMNAAPKPNGNGAPEDVQYDYPDIEHVTQGDNAVVVKGVSVTEETKPNIAPGLNGYGAPADVQYDYPDIEHLTAGDKVVEIRGVRVGYLKVDDKNRCDSNTEDLSNTYNTLIQYQNPNENLYSCLDKTQV